MQFINQEAILLFSLILVLFFCGVLYLYIYISNLLKKQDVVDKKINALSLEVDNYKIQHIPTDKNDYVLYGELKTDEKGLSEEELNPVEEEIAAVEEEEAVEEAVEKVEAVEERKPEEFYTLLRLMGSFEVYRSPKEIIKWRLVSGTKEVLLSSTSNYSSEITCGKGVEAVLRVVRSATTRPVITIEAINSKKYKVILKSGNGKILGESPVLSTKAESERIKELAYAQINKNTCVISIMNKRIRLKV